MSESVDRIILSFAYFVVFSSRRSRCSYRWSTSIRLSNKLALFDVVLTESMPIPTPDLMCFELIFPRVLFFAFCGSLSPDEIYLWWAFWLEEYIYFLSCCIVLLVDYTFLNAFSSISSSDQFVASRFLAEFFFGLKDYRIICLDFSMAALLTVNGFDSSD